MPVEAVVTCIGDSLRQELANSVAELDPQVQEIAMQLLDALPQCSNGEPIGLALQESNASQTRRRQKRPLSAYNQHMSRCLKAGGTFASCVQEWRDQKNREGRANAAA